MTAGTNGFLAKPITLLATFQETILGTYLQIAIRMDHGL
jgi:hypothetical protein